MLVGASCVQNYKIWKHQKTEALWTHESRDMKAYLVWTQTHQSLQMNALAIFEKK